MTEPRKLRVFLCHASQDKPVVRELYQRLLAEGWIDPWLDEEKLLPGQNWDLEIEKAVEDADAVIVCLSANSMTEKGNFQRGMQFVLDIALEKPEGTIFVIPVRLNDCLIPRRLKHWDYIDYFLSIRNKSYEEILQIMISKIQYQLIIQSGPNPGRIFPVYGDQLTIGRDSSNDISINNPEVSRKHARLSFLKNNYVIEDLASMNGTFVNKARLESPVLLKLGDSVSLGDQIVLKYSFGNVKIESPVFPEVNTLSNAKETSSLRRPSNVLDVLFNRQQTQGLDNTIRVQRRSPKVFISYSQKDFEFVKKLANDLEEYGVDVWWDVSKLKGGDAWIHSIQSALDQSQYCIVVVTPDSVRSHWVEREYVYALNNKVKIIPVYLKTVEKMPFVFSTVQRVDFRDIQYKSAIKNLFISIDMLK